MPDLLGADKFSQKIERLLAFYAEKLTGAERHLTGLVALFPNAVSRTVLTKLTEMLDDPDFLGGPALDGALQALEGDGLLLREPGADAWSAHPVVRDYFRAQGGNAAITAADLVAGRPAEERVKRIDEIRGVLDAIAILCDAGQYVAALSLYNSRCEYGRVFMRLGAMREWYDIASRFTREEALDQLSDREQDRVLNDAAIAGEGYGDLVRAAEMALRAVEISEARKDWTNAAINRSNRAPILSHYRPAAEVVEEAERALALAEKSHAVEIIVVSRACLGVCLAEAGRAGDAAGHAAAAYATARCNPISFDSSRRSFRSLAGNVLFVLGRADLAAALYRDEAKIMARDGYVGDAAWFEACAAGAEGNAAVCLVGLRKTVETARRHGDVRRMSLGYIGISGFLSDLGNAEGAEEAARRAVEIAASRGYMCYHADALAAHAAALAALGRGGAARIVAEDALAIIQPLGNVVVGRKAWRALASAAGVLNDAELETQSRAEAARIDAMLVWPEDVEFPPLDPPEDAK
jgi:tetratricopeptide (TPR) repeat protein